MSRASIARAHRMAGSPMVRAAVACKGKHGKRFKACRRRWEKIFERSHRRRGRR